MSPLVRLEDSFGIVPAADGMSLSLNAKAPHAAKAATAIKLWAEKLAIDPASKKAPKLAQALKAWLAQIDSEKSGEITAEQLAEWKAIFSA